MILNFLKKIGQKHKDVWTKKVFITSVIFGSVIFLSSLFVNYAAVQFAIYESGAATTDIILSNLPVVNTDIVFSEGALVFTIFVGLLLLIEPKTIPYTLKTIGLFVCIRALFVIMTHYGPYADHIQPDISAFRYVSSGADLFFSGHTGIPFLLAMMFWQRKYLRNFFIFCSFVAAVAVLLGHLHYTIDVFSAYFIAYGINRIAQLFFPEDHTIFLQGVCNISEAV